jgi:hypothetical protein
LFGVKMLKCSSVRADGMTHGTDCRTSSTATLYANIPSELLQSSHVHLFALSDCIMVPRGNCQKGSTHLSAGMSLESQNANRSRGKLTIEEWLTQIGKPLTSKERIDFLRQKRRGVGDTVISHFKLLCVLWLRTEKNRY